MYMERVGSTEAEAGIYTWSLGEDRVYGDTAVAALFGLDPDLTIQGLPLTAYMARVHDSDRQMLAALIAQAVRDGCPFNAEYRVRNNREEFEVVMALGRCFRDQTGNPTLYSGIIYPVQKMF